MRMNLSTFGRVSKNGSSGSNDVVEDSCTNK
jgi:hypothetical protein